MQIKQKTYKLEQFEGPLDLLLTMIQQEKLDISEISLAVVAEQFVKYVENNPDIGGQELADFLVVATQLLLLKSKLLLPAVEVEEDLHPDALQTQLKLYRRFVDASQRLQTRIEQRQFLYARKKSPFELKQRFSPPTEFDQQAMANTMQSVIKRLEPIVILPQSIMEKTITMHQKIVDIQRMLKRKSGISFRKLLEKARSKTEQIVSFLALLELVKQEEVAVQQVKAFDDILIKRN